MGKAETKSQSRFFGLSLLDNPEKGTQITHRVRERALDRESKDLPGLQLQPRYSGQVVTTLRFP